MKSAVATTVNNTSRILVTQRIPDAISATLRKLRANCIHPSSKTDNAIVENIDHFPTDQPKNKRALLSLSTQAWQTAIAQFPNIRLFNYVGITYEIVRSLNENGYLVDIVDFTHEHKPIKDYDMFVGHGGNCRSIIDHLREDTPILQYVSGLHWQAFNDESSERYNSFSIRKNVESPLKFRRSFENQATGEDYLSEKATALFTINCPRMVNSYGKHVPKFFYTGLGAYPDARMKVDRQARNFKDGRKKFLYVGGTGGNIQKGADLIIDAFAQNPDLHLYIFCKIEPELITASHKELNLPNIHFIHHWRHRPFRKILENLLQEMVFTVHAPINIGLGTAFMATLGEGFIPVGYLDYNGPHESAILTHSWQVESLSTCIQEASRKSPEWCESASQLAREFYLKHCSPDAFHARFSELVRTHTK